jgi:arylsulfatase A-like enzyme
MMWSDLLLSGACVLSVALLSGGVVAQTGAPSRPNIILAMADDQGWGDVSYNGLTKIKTPTLDAMAASGLRLDRGYAAGPNCSPTRASVLTGRNPNRSGVIDHGKPLRKQELTIAQVLKNVGYATSHFGKWHLDGSSGGKFLAADDPLSPGKFGFTEWLSKPTAFELDATLSRMGTREKCSGDGSTCIVDKALQYMRRSVERNEPFFVLVWFSSPHGPWAALPADKQAAGGSAYYGEIVAMDRAMRNLRNGLRDMGVANNTLLWFTSDNGPIVPPGSTGGLRGKKATLWEGGLRVPTIIEWPNRIKSPRRSRVPVVTSDIYPTIVDLLGLTVPNQVQPIDGISLVPLLNGTMDQRPRPIGFWYDTSLPLRPADGPAAWTDNQYKLIRVDGTYRLFDLVADPKESTNLASSNQAIVRQMKTALTTWQESVVRSYKGEDY